jgi:hypothetical protein
MEHVPKTKDELLAILDDIRESVANDDSFEGSIEYLMPEPLGVDPQADFAVRASYRVGNQMGQGSVRLVGAIS